MDEEKKKKNDNINNDSELNKKVIDVDTEEELIEALNNLLNDEDKEPDVVIKNYSFNNITIRTFKNLFVDYIYNLILNMALIVGICGWFKVLQFDNIYMLFIFAFLFGSIDYLIKHLIYKFNPLLFFKTLGYIFTLVSTLVMGALVTVGYLFFNVGLTNAWIIIGSYFLFLVVRAIVLTYVKKIK